MSVSSRYMFIGKISNKLCVISSRLKAQSSSLIAFSEESVGAEGLDADAEDGGIGDDLLPDYLDNQPVGGYGIGTIGEQQEVADEHQAEDGEDPRIDPRVAFFHEHGRNVE
jgi:hypothetical protein